MTLVTIILSLILIVFLSIFTIDWIPLAREWSGRIGIGKIHDQKEWEKKILDRGLKWLTKTPKMKITDQTRLIALDIVRGDYTRESLQHWQEATLVLGLSEYLKVNEDLSVKQELLKFINKKIDKNGQWITEPQHVDSTILVYSILQCKFLNLQQYQPAFDTMWNLIQDHVGKDGTVMYRKSMENYRYVDTIGFICPFLINYGILFDKPECVELAVKQINNFERFGMFSDNFIPFHAYDTKLKVPLGLLGWGRGLGWYGLGLVDSWAALPEGSNNKKVLENNLVKFTRTIINLQQPNGNWNWTVTRKESTPDSSTTASLAWVLFKASKIDGLSEDCLEAGEKATNYLKSVTRRDGSIDFSQGDTKDIGVYSQLYNVFPFTQGLGIRCTNIKLGEGNESDEDHRFYAYI